jgi:hypothetical protein
VYNFKFQYPYGRATRQKMVARRRLRAVYLSVLRSYLSITTSFLSIMTSLLSITKIQKSVTLKNDVATLKRSKLMLKKNLGSTAHSPRGGSTAPFGLSDRGKDTVSVGAPARFRLRMIRSPALDSPATVDLSHDHISVKTGSELGTVWTIQCHCTVRIRYTHVPYCECV